MSFTWQVDIVWFTTELVSNLSASTVLFSKFQFWPWPKTTLVSLMQVVRNSHKIGRFSGRFKQFQGLSGFDMLCCCLHQWTLYFVSACQYIGFCCVQISDKAILLFFVLLSCKKDKCLPIVITWWADRWKQYSYCSIICSWIFTDLELRKKVNWLLQNANWRSWNQHFEKGKSNSRQKINKIRTGVILKIEVNRKKIDRKLQLSKWKKFSFREIRFRFQKTSLYKKSVPELFNEGRKILGKRYVQNNIF